MLFFFFLGITVLLNFTSLHCTLFTQQFKIQIQCVHCATYNSLGACSKARSALTSVHNNNNNSHDNVYGAVIVTKVIARVHPVHLMNVDWAPGCESAENWQLSSTSTIAIVIITHPVGWYSFYRPTKDGRLTRPSTAIKVHSPCSRLYITAAVATNTTVSGVIRTWILSHRSQMR